MSRFPSNPPAVRRRQLCILQDDTDFLLNPVPDAAAVRSRQLSLLRDEETTPPLNPFPDATAMRRRQIHFQDDNDDFGLAPGVTEEPSPPTRRNQPTGSDSGGIEDIRHTRALERLHRTIQSNLEAADEFLQTLTPARRPPPPNPPPLLPPLPRTKRRDDYKTCFYLRPVIELAINSLILYHQRRSGGIRRSNRRLRLSPDQVLTRVRVIMNGLGLRINRRTRNAIKDGSLLRLCDEVLHSSPGHATKRELAKANKVWKAVLATQASDPCTPETVGRHRARNLFCKSTPAKERHCLPQPQRKERDDVVTLFWNCNGLKSNAKKHVIRQTAAEHRVDIVALAETKTNFTFPQLPEFRTSSFLSGTPKSGAAPRSDLMGGLWSGVMEESDIRAKRIMNSPSFVEFRICRYAKRDVAFTHINAYLPGPSRARGKPKYNSFLDDLRSLYNSGPLLLTADFNYDLNTGTGAGKPALLALTQEGWIIHNPQDETGKYIPTCVRSTTGSTIDLVLSKDMQYPVSCDILPLSVDDHQGLLVTIRAKKNPQRPTNRNECNPFAAKRFALALEDPTSTLHAAATSAMERHLGIPIVQPNPPTAHGAYAELLRIRESISPMRPSSPTTSQQEYPDSDGESTNVCQGSPRPTSPEGETQLEQPNHPQVYGAYAALVRIRDGISPMRPSPSNDPSCGHPPDPDSDEDSTTVYPGSPLVSPPEPPVYHQDHSPQDLQDLQDLQDFQDFQDFQDPQDFPVHAHREPNRELTETWGAEIVLDFISDFICLALTFMLRTVKLLYTFIYRLSLRPLPAHRRNTEAMWRQQIARVTRTLMDRQRRRHAQQSPASTSAPTSDTVEFPPEWNHLEPRESPSSPSQQKQAPSTIAGIVNAINDFSKNQEPRPPDPLYIAWRKSCTMIPKLMRQANSKSIRTAHKALSQIRRHKNNAKSLVKAMDSRILSEKAFTSLQEALRQKTITTIGKQLDRGMRTRSAMLDASTLGAEGLELHRAFWANEVGTPRALPPQRETKVNDFLIGRADIPTTARASPFSVTRNPDGSFWEITTDELEHAVSKMAWHRAPGPSGIPVDVYKISATLRDTLLQPLNDFIQGLPGPKEFNLCRLILLFKKGDRALPSNYRPINLTETAYRVLETVLRLRMDSWFESQLDTNQHGFRHKQSTVSALFRLCIHVQLANKSKKPLYAAFLDAVKAYDRVPHSAVIEALARRGLDRESCSVILKLLADHVTKFSDMLDAALNFEVGIHSGVMQGGILSPPLFSMFIDAMAEVSGMESDNILYADDRTIFDEEEHRLQKTLQLLEASCTPAHLRHNVQKNEAIHFHSFRPTLSLEGAEIPVKAEVVTLGITLKATGKMHRANSAAIAHVTCTRVSRVWLQARRATFSMFRTLASSYALPAALYGSTVCDWQKSQLDAIDRSMCNTIRSVTRAHATTNKLLLHEFSGILRPHVRAAIQTVSDVSSLLINPFVHIRLLVKTAAKENLPFHQKFINILTPLKFPACGPSPNSLFEDLLEIPQGEAEDDGTTWLPPPYVPARPSQDVLIGFTDGSSDPNPGSTGCATVILFAGRVLLDSYFLGENLSNNFAEWTAALKCIEKAIILQAKTILIVSDSLGVVLGLRGLTSIQDPPLASILQQIVRLVLQHELNVTAKWVEAHQKTNGNHFNEVADGLAGRASAHHVDSHSERLVTEWDLDKSTQPIVWSSAEVTGKSLRSRIAHFKNTTTNAILFTEHMHYVEMLPHIPAQYVNFPRKGSEAALTSTLPGGEYLIELRRCRQQHFVDHGLFVFMHGCTLCTRLRDSPATMQHIMECSLDALNARDQIIVRKFQKHMKEVRERFQKFPIQKCNSPTEMLHWATSSQYTGTQQETHRLVTRTRSLMRVLNNRYQIVQPLPLEAPEVEPEYMADEYAGDNMGANDGHEPVAHRFLTSSNAEQRIVILDRMLDCRTPEEFDRWKEWANRDFTTLSRWHVNHQRTGLQAEGYREFLCWCQSYLTLLACPTWELRQTAWNMNPPLRGSRNQEGLKGIRARFHYLGTHTCQMLRYDIQWPYYMDWTFTATTSLAEAWFAAPTSTEQRNLLGADWPAEWSKTTKVALRKLQPHQFRRTSLPKSLHWLFRCLHDAIKFHEISLEPPPTQLPTKNNDWNAYCTTVVQLILSPIELIRQTTTITINPINFSRSSVHNPDNSLNRSQNPTFPAAILPHPPRLDVFNHVSLILQARNVAEAIEVAKAWTNRRLETLGPPKLFPPLVFPLLPSRTAAESDDPMDLDEPADDDLFTVDGLSSSSDSSPHPTPSPPDRPPPRAHSHARR